MRQLACWGSGFESRRDHGCLPLVSAECFQAEISASADHSSRGVLPSEVYLSECDSESSILKRPWPTRAVAPW